MNPDSALQPCIYMVDDEEAVRHALMFLLQSRGLAVQSFASAPELLGCLPPPTQVRGCFLLDVRMEPISGLALHNELLQRGVRNPVLLMTGHGDIPMAVEALKKGAFDFLEKPYSDNKLVDRIEQALAVDAAMHNQQAIGAEARARLASLTEREHEVMQRVAIGKLNKVIADELGIAVRTVEVHRARVFSKLGVRSAPEVATLLAQHVP